MKKPIFILSIILSISLCGCEKFLTELPQDTAAPETYYQTKDQLTAALMSVYSPLGAYNQSTFARFLSLEAQANTDDFTTKSSSGTTAAVYNASASYRTFGDCWNNLYLGIERANLLLEKLATSTAPEADKNQIKGEALFLRGYYYFLLVSYWGDVPLKLTSTKNASEVAIARTPAKQVYDQIIKDMEEAEGLVQTATAWGTSVTGRVSKTAVEGILCRVNLHAAGRLKDNSYLPDALSWSEKVIASGEHSLNPDFKQIFINQVQDINDNRECMWELEFYADPADIYREYERNGSTIGIPNNNIALGFMQGAYCGSGTLYNSYADGDLRRDWTMTNYLYVGSDAARGKIYTNPATVWGRPFAKWRREYQRPDVISNKNFGSINFPMLRYADVLLMFAEVKNELDGPTSSSAIAGITPVDAVNMVRRRGYGIPLNGRQLKKITISGGTGYSLNSTVVISGGGASRDAKAVVSSLSGSRITGLTILDGGANYTGNPTITISGGTGATITPTISNLTDADLLPADYASQDAFRSLIMKERSRELVGEGVRKLDLYRWGTFTQVMTDMIPIVTANFRGLIGAFTNATTLKGLSFPIPIREMTLNPLMKDHQNPGWE